MFRRLFHTTRQLFQRPPPMWVWSTLVTAATAQNRRLKQGIDLLEQENCHLRQALSLNIDAKDKPKSQECSDSALGKHIDTGSSELRFYL